MSNDRPILAAVLGIVLLIFMGAWAFFEDRLEKTRRDGERKYYVAELGRSDSWFRKPGAMGQAMAAFFYATQGSNGSGIFIGVPGTAISGGLGVLPAYTVWGEGR